MEDHSLLSPPPPHAVKVKVKESGARARGSSCVRAPLPCPRPPARPRPPGPDGRPRLQRHKSASTRPATRPEDVESHFGEAPFVVLVWLCDCFSKSTDLAVP